MTPECSNLPPANLLFMGCDSQPFGAFGLSLWQGWGNLNNGANDGFVASNGRNDLGNANVNNGSRYC